MSVASVALEHQARTIRRSDAATGAVLRLWNRVDVAELDVSWAVVAPSMVELASAAQVANAKDSNRYATAVSADYGVNSRERIVPEAFEGVDGSGRDVEGLLHGAVTTTKQAIGAGSGLAEAFLSGGAYLAAMMKTALADVGRSSDLTAATGKGFTRYVRIINPGACSRCAILAGKSDYRTAFKRHPACRCTSAPVLDTGRTASGLIDSPEDYFDSLSAAEQDRIFTRGGAEAIRAGADPISVVSARRGVSTSKALSPNGIQRLQKTRIGKNSNGTPIFGYVTSEGTTKRGAFRKAGGVVLRRRLMPETIVGMTDSVDLRKTLLRDAGFLDFPAGTAPTDVARLRVIDRNLAADFYRSRGIAA